MGAIAEFWATWCIPCHRVMPEMQRLHGQFANRGVIVIGVSTSERGDPALLMKERGYTYLLLMGGESIGDAYRVAALPTVYLIGPDGRVLHADLDSDSTAAPARRTAILRSVNGAREKREGRS